MLPTHRKRTGLWVTGCFALPALLAAAVDGPQPEQRLTYPPAERGAVSDSYHGTAVADPYRWLEDLDSPATKAWVSAEKALADNYFASVPARGAIRARVAALHDYETFRTPFQERGRYFYGHNTGLQDQDILYTFSTSSPKPRIALDPNLLSADGSLAVVGYVLNRSATRLAYGVSEGGSDWTDWHIRDLASGKDLPDVLRYTKYYQPAFTRNGKGLYYSAFPPPRPGTELTVPDLRNAVYFHELRTPGAADRKVFERSAHPDWQFEPHLSRDGRWLVILAGEGEVGDKALENIYLLDLAAPASTAVAISETFDAAYNYIGTDAGLIYFLTTLDAPRGRVIAIDPARPHRAHWRHVVAEGPDALDFTSTSVTLVDHQLIIQTIHDARSRVATYGLDGHLRREITLPGLGTARGFAGHADDRETFFSFSNLITPPTVYRYDLETGTSPVFRGPKAPFDDASFEQRQVFYPARDGTKIPMLLAYRKGLRLDGENPVLLYGYGGFGIPLLPYFDPAVIAWLEMGGIYAVANIRGGGEYGEAWHRQGIRGNKQRVFDDFIAAGEWLVAQRYTANRRLAIEGGSNGGLLVGACETQRPELYAAVIAEVGVMDMLRFDRFGQGAGWIGDYGSPGNADDFKALYAYSPVHNVRPALRYPATLVITGDHDTRVMPMHSFKFAAALQAAQAGPAPVLMRVEIQSGHGGGTTLAQKISQRADVLAFLAGNLGIGPSATWARQVMLAPPAGVEPATYR